MPTYTFYDSELDICFDEVMSYKERQDFIFDHPHIRVVIQAPTIVTNVGSEIKTDDGFQEVLQKIGEHHPDTSLGERYKSRSIKEAQTKQAVEKWRKARARDLK